MIMLWSIGQASAQEEDPVVLQKGLFAAQSTLSTGLGSASVKRVYLHGDLEYFPDANISIRGDIYVHLSTPGGTSDIDKVHSSFAGPVIHFGKKQLDPHLGVQPGVAFSRRVGVEGAPAPSTKVSPLLSPMAGLNYYGLKYFHLFLNVRYVMGKEAIQPDPESLNELRFSFGLGFHLSS